MTTTNRTVTADKSTSQRVLDVAERLAQTRGLNGFSYAAIAAEIGITTASLHYHFPTKVDLAKALVVRHRGRFQRSLDGILETKDSMSERIRAYVAIYRRVLCEGRMCLCGMLAAEFETLHPDIQQELRLYFDANRIWLITAFEQGSSTRQLALNRSPAELADFVTSTVEGAMLLARVYKDVEQFDHSTRPLFDGLEKSAVPDD